MADTGGHSNSTVTGGDSNSNDPELWVAIASLVIALVALLGTILQVLQQYYASATGFSNCNERVIGPWAAETKRNFRSKELRFEVQFATPVILVCEAYNKSFPIKDWFAFIEGTEKSIEATKTDTPKERTPPTDTLRGWNFSIASPGISSTVTRTSFAKQLSPQPSPPAAPAGRVELAEPTTARTSSFQHLKPSLSMPKHEPSNKKPIHTADNERATWVSFLTELQSMERDSDDWQTTVNEWHKANNQLGDRKPPEFKQRSLAIAVQPKNRSWDSMPSNIKKPYATTTLCHLVEMTAMLGLHWKEFDRSNDKYRAEGNGYVLTGTYVLDLGVVFNFQVSGKNRFMSNRIVPSCLVKEFAFGVIPTIFNPHPDKTRRDFVTEKPVDMENLLLGSVNEFAETVALFGCNTQTANTLRDNNKNHGHLFPSELSTSGEDLVELEFAVTDLLAISVAFELVGMLSKTPYIQNLSFRMLPNPTFYTWDNNFFSLRRILREFGLRMDGDALNETFAKALPTLPPRIIADQTSELRDQISTVINALDEQTSYKKDGAFFTFDFCDALLRAIDSCDVELKQVSRRKMNKPSPPSVKVVIREHVQEILRILNNEDDDDGDKLDKASVRSGVHAKEVGGSAAPRIKQTRMDLLRAASPEERHEVLMDLYFYALLPRVVSRVGSSMERLKRRPTTAIHRLTDIESIISQSPVHSPTERSPLSAAGSPLLDDDAKEKGVGIWPGPSHRPTDEELAKLEIAKVWCTLIFRMLCWLLLHDFHKNDRQICSKYEICNSRLPVYIG